MSDEEKTEEPDKAVAFVCPSELWGEIIKLLGSQPYEKVSGVLNKMYRVPPQEVSIKK